MFNSVNHTNLSGLYARVRLIGLLLLLSYPLFYYSYKFSLPDMGGADYFHYLHLYENWDVQHTEAPFNMRLIGSYATYLVHTSGLNYNTETVFAQVHPELSQQVYFSALLVNYLCVVATAFILFRTLRRMALGLVLSMAGALLFLLGFGTIFFLLKPANDACGVLLLAIAFGYYTRRSYWILPVLALTILQREYVAIVFGVIALVEFYFSRQRYYIHVLVSAIAAFAMYFILRKTFFYSPLHDGQTKPGFFLQSLLHPEVEWGPFVKQLALSCNLLMLYIAVVFYKKRRGLSFSIPHLACVCALFVQVLLMSIMAGFGNNTGRIFYFSAPILIVYLLLEAKPVLVAYLSRNLD